MVIARCDVAISSFLIISYIKNILESKCVENIEVTYGYGEEQEYKPFNFFIKERRWINDMKITLFTGNQPRHLRFADALSKVCDSLYVIQECCTVFPGEIKDFYDNSEIMNRYFTRVRAAENKIFGSVRFLPQNVFQLAIKDGDLTFFKMDDLKDALESDYYIVYGSSFIKGELADFLIEHKAINLHLGISPYYRGNSCNFWALYNGQPEMVGATIMLLGKGLDSGTPLFHCFPKARYCDGFDLGMYAVLAAQNAIVNYIKKGELFDMEAGSYPDVPKEKIYYTKRIDFTDPVAERYMKSMMMEEEIFTRLSERKLDMFLNPCLI